MNATPQKLHVAASGNKTASEIEQVFYRQQAFAIRLRASKLNDRLLKLNKLEEVVNRRKSEIYAATAADFSKPEAEVDLTEIFPVRHEIKQAKRHLKNWMKPNRVRPTLAMIGTQSWTIHEPKGVCLIISPWNYPINLTFGPLVSAIAAGNTAIIKPSEMTPHCSSLIKSIVEEVFEQDEVAVFEGDVQTSEQLLTLPFNHIFFTGSPAVGRIVMHAASEYLASVTLELGGKSPVIIDESANIKKAAKNLIWGKFSNNGQTCIAPDHIYVHENIMEEFVRCARAVIKQVYGENVAQQQLGKDYCRIVNDRHFTRLSNLLDDAKAKGGVIAEGGHVDADDRFISPTLLINVPDNADIMQQEIFGPLLPLIPYTNVKTVIDHINSQPKPLALYIFSTDNKQTEEILTNTSAGGSCINHSVVHFLHSNLPFGGVNNSGLGSAHGYYGFKAFSHERSILKDRLSITHWLFPPYTPTVKKLIDMTVRFFI
tara:strand:+ start:20820 stop:22274 length:1455 start_codon:yes stop_codon:yes gene_type:complete